MITLNISFDFFHREQREGRTENIVVLVKADNLSKFILLIPTLKELTY